MRILKNVVRKEGYAKALGQRTGKSSSSTHSPNTSLIPCSIELFKRFLQFNMI
jgi:hypothetical protein